ncbi:MAG: DUF2089 domain-containing protein [Candidatus Hydrogenedentes bacterium]|nr:DUF2089 domain-containing protein [Candidatus Hydrogenedentota bacterium]
MSETIPRWLADLSEDELLFVKRFLLASGSLKQLASEYGVSYPTLRARLDRLIEKVRVRENPENTGTLDRLVGLLVEEGVLLSGTARTIIQAHKRDMKSAMERVDTGLSYEPETAPPIEA